MKLRRLEQLRRYPRHAIWEITRRCDLQCIHCEGSAGKRDPAELTPAEALAVCDDLIAMGCEQCNISGGEPLLRPDWDQLCARLARGGVKLTLVTNGTHLDSMAIRRALDAGVTGVALSVDGMRHTHDRIRRGGKSSFDAVRAAVAALVPSSLSIAVITHISRWNLAELESIHEMLRVWGARFWQVQLGLPLGRQRDIGEPYMISPTQLVDVTERLAKLIRGGRPPIIRVTDTIGYYGPHEPALRRSVDGQAGFYSGCYAGMLTIGIESNGDVKGCSSMPAEFVAGNVRDTPLPQIWADESRFAYNSRFDDAHLTGFCATCAYRRLCRAGCTSLAYSVTGTVHENPYCVHRVLTTGTKAS